MGLLLMLIGLVFRVIQGLLWVRFALKLFGAGAGNALVAWVYNISAKLLAPFAGILPNIKLFGFVVVEFNTLLAILIYAVIYMIIRRVGRVVG